MTIYKDKKIHPVHADFREPERINYYISERLWHGL